MEQKKITQGDLVSMFLRSNLQQASFNFERIHGLGFCYDMIPAIKRLYPLKADQVAALKRHLVFFNTTPAVCGPVIGVTAAMEEARANGAAIDDGAINGIKVGLMGPLAGVGDPLVWGTLRPITAALGASLALSGNILGPLLFFFIFNAMRLAMKWYGLQLGFRKGVNIVSDMGGNLLQKLTEGASILGLFVMGVLVTKWTTINVPLVVSQTPGADGATVTMTVQNILDQLCPGLYSAVRTGIGSADRQLLEMAQVFRLPLGRRLRAVWLPAVLPAFRQGCSVALGICWKSGVAAEVIGLPDGSIGDALYRAKITLSTGELFAWTFVIILLSAVFEKLFLALLDKAVAAVLGEEGAEK